MFKVSYFMEVLPIIASKVNITFQLTIAATVFALIVGVIIFVFIGGICWLLTTNYSVYHNIMGFCIEYLDYFVSNKNYVFEGIVNYDEEKDKKNTEEQSEKL